jgi:hypothetical protein
MRRREFIALLGGVVVWPIRATDFTDDTKPFVAARLAAWQKESVTHKDQYGTAAYATMETFYATLSRLLENGSFGCTGLVAKRE